MNNIQAITTFMSVSTKRKLKESHFPLDRKNKNRSNFIRSIHRLVDVVVALETTSIHLITKIKDQFNMTTKMILYRSKAY
jgi:hypothetical protein